MNDRREFLRQAAGIAAALAIEPDAGWPAAPYRPPAPIAVGVAGAGRQGREILGELAKFENVAVAAVCEPDAGRLSRSLRRTKDAKGFAGVEEAIKAQPEIAAWVVATPTHRHKEVALRLIDAGKHVYCEAPLASTIEDAKALARAAAAAKTVFQVGHVGRTNPVYRLARSFYRSDSIQKLVAARTQFRRKISWRTPVSDPAQEQEQNWRLDPAVSLGLVGEESSHQLDTVLWFTGRTPMAVQGRGATFLWEDGRAVPDTVNGVVRLDGGVDLAFEATLCNSFEGSCELLVGTMGAIRLAERFGWLFKEADAPIQGWEVYASRQQFHNEEGITLIADATKLASQGKLKEGIGLPNPALYYALESFLKSVAEGAPVACTAKDGLATAALAVLASQAVTGGREVAIPPAALKAD